MEVKVGRLLNYGAQSDAPLARFIGPRVPFTSRTETKPACCSFCPALRSDPFNGVDGVRLLKFRGCAPNERSVQGALS